MAIIDDFKARFPEPAFTTAEVDLYLPNLIEIYSCYNGWNYSTKCGKEVILNLLAHLLVNEVDASPEPIQMLASISVGDVSLSNVAKAINSQDSDFFSSTKYGRRYLQLISKNFGGIFV